MQFHHYLFLGLIFLIVVIATALIAWMYWPNPTAQRLRRLQGQREAAQPEPSWGQRLSRLLRPFARLSQPDESWESSGIRLKLANAGIRGQNAALLLFGVKTAGVLLAPGLYLMLSILSAATFDIIYAVMLAGGAYYLPDVWLSGRARAYRQTILHAFPEAVDLMTVCVEAGLGLDAAMMRVAEEMRLTSKELSAELGLVILELRAGSTRERALRGFAVRTGLSEVQTFAAMIIQADRFGTSVVESLRVYSDELRNKRQQKAEETAAKIATKLLFPLILFLFPALIVVLIGPGILTVLETVGN